MFGWIVAFIVIIIWVILQAIWRSIFGRGKYRWHGHRRWRTPRWVMVLKLFVVAFLLVFPITFLHPPGIQDTADGVKFSLMLAAIVNVFFWGLGWIIVTSLNMLVCGPEYVAVIFREGGDLFFDLMGPPLNNDCEAVTDGGPPPDISPQNFTPPSSWTDTCPTCGQKQPGPIFWCWNCKTGWNHNRLKFKCPGCEKLFVESSPGDSREYGEFACTTCGFVMDFRPSGA